MFQSYSINVNNKSLLRNKIIYIWKNYAIIFIIVLEDTDFTLARATNILISSSVCRFDED